MLRPLTRGSSRPSTKDKPRFARNFQAPNSNLQTFRI
jgi:hypothetical protein